MLKKVVDKITDLGSQEPIWLLWLILDSVLLISAIKSAYSEMMHCAECGGIMEYLSVSNALVLLVIILFVIRIVSMLRALLD